MIPPNLVTGSPDRFVELSPGATTVVRGGQLIDGTGSKARSANIVIAGDIIEAVLAPDIPLSVQDDARIIDASGKWIIPGLIDVHVHLTGQATMEPYKRYLWPSDGVKTIRAAVDAFRAYEAGWTTLVDLGWPSPGRDIRDAIRDGVIVGPRILTAIAALSQTGGHGDWHAFPYAWVKEHEWRGRIVDGVDECRKAVRLNFREGADLTKIMVTSAGLGSKHDWPPRVIFGQDELDAITDETRKHRGTVAAHCFGAEGVRAALAAGVNTIEHGVIGEEDYDVLATMAESDVTLVPTLSIFYWFEKEGAARGMPQWGVDMAAKVRETQSRMVRRALEEGVPIAAGTDTGSSYGIGKNSTELALLADAGLSPLDALKAATLNSANARGLGEILGTVTAGKLADMVILNVDPTKSLERLQDGDAIHRVLRARDDH